MRCVIAILFEQLLESRVKIRNRFCKSFLLRQYWFFTGNSGSYISARQQEPASGDIYAGNDVKQLKTHVAKFVLNNFQISGTIRRSKVPS